MNAGGNQMTLVFVCVWLSPCVFNLRDRLLGCQYLVWSVKKTSKYNSVAEIYIFFVYLNCETDYSARWLVPRFDLFPCSSGGSQKSGSKLMWSRRKGTKEWNNGFFWYRDVNRQEYFWCTMMLTRSELRFFLQTIQTPTN